MGGVAQSVQRRVKRIAEAAFWDSVEASLMPSQQTNAEGPSPAAQVAALLGQLGADLQAVLPEGAQEASEQLRTHLDPETLLAALVPTQVSRLKIVCLLSSPAMPCPAVPCFLLLLSVELNPLE